MDVWDYNYFGSHEFMEFLDHVGGDAYINVNFGSGTVREAADWVQYMNGDVTTPMGALREENGHSEPFDVALWGIGNETYGFWSIRNTDAVDYAMGFNEFNEAMEVELAGDSFDVEMTESYD